MRVEIGERVIIVPQGVEVRVIDDKPKFKVGDYVSYEGGVYRITELTGRGYRVDEIRRPKDADGILVETAYHNEPKMELLPDYKEHKFKGGEYISFEGVVYQIVSPTDRGYAVREVGSPKNVHWETIELGFINEPKMAELPDYEEIIDAWGNAHDATLSVKINHAWNKNREGFCPILRALYARDIDEITDHDSFMYEEWKDTSEYRHGLSTGDWEAYNAMALKHMEREWDFFADNYLNHIADDCDLECILNFLHYPYLPIYQN